MNKYSYIILVLLCLSISRLNAQSQTADERFIEAMSALDMTPVTAGTGLFLDRVPSVIPLHLFHGAAISDTLRGSRGLLLIAHASMYGADLGVSPLDAPDTYVAKLDHYTESDTVMLGAMLGV